MTHELITSDEVQVGQVVEVVGILGRWAVVERLPDGQWHLVNPASGAALTMAFESKEYVALAA